MQLQMHVVRQSVYCTPTQVYTYMTDYRYLQISISIGLVTESVSHALELMMKYQSVN